MSRPQKSKRPLNRAARRQMMREMAEERAERDGNAVTERGRAGHRQCGRKVRYDTWESAVIAAMGRTRAASVDLRAYHCDICGGYHLTHKTRNERCWDAVEGAGTGEGLAEEAQADR